MGQLVFQATLGGQVNLVGPNTASTFNLNVPAVAGTLITSGDSATVTNTMLAGSIANAKLLNSSVTVGSTAIALGATATTVAGLTSLATNTLTSASATALTLQSAGTTAITVDTSQNVGIGTSSPVAKLDVRGTSNTVATTIQIVGNSVSTLLLGQNADGGVIRGQGGNNALSFWTGGSGDTGAGLSGSERMRLDSSGNLLVGQASQSSSGKVCITFPSDTFAGVVTTTAAVTTQIHYRFVNANGIVGSITTTGSASLFNTTSDQRLKENIVDAPEFGSVIDSIKVRSFDWKTDNTHQRAGFVAQELVTVAPEAVHQPANEEDMMAVDYSKLVPMLVKEIQSLRKRLTALEST